MYERNATSSNWRDNIVAAVVKMYHLFSATTSFLWNLFALSYRATFNYNMSLNYVVYQDLSIFPPLYVVPDNLSRQMQFTPFSQTRVACTLIAQLSSNILYINRDYILRDEFKDGEVGDPRGWSNVHKIQSCPCVIERTDYLIRVRAELATSLTSTIWSRLVRQYVNS